jgi:sterol desaturase/sphingolipid hydroxylase (fatty acid hydroxylase superfamily)
MLLSAAAEFFYHWNIRTPSWLGFIVQRPESHRVHHQYRHHTQNFADLPFWDMLFGTFKKDVHRPGAEGIPPLHLLPTCIGCAKRWACFLARKKEDR